MQWLDDYIRPRQSKHNDTFDPSLENESSIDMSHSQSFAATQYGNDSEDSNPATCSKTLPPLKRKVAQIKPKESSKQKKETSDIEKEEMDILRSIAAATSNNANSKDQDEYDCYGQYIANKMRKLSKILDEDEMELLEFNVNTVFLNARKQRQQQPVYQQQQQQQQQNLTPFLDLLRS